jgi:hypothetical protein
MSKPFTNKQFIKNITRTNKKNISTLNINKEINKELDQLEIIIKQSQIHYSKKINSINSIDHIRSRLDLITCHLQSHH